MTEEQINYLNSMLLKYIEKRMGHSTSTYTNELTKIGRQLLGDKYHGTYTSDMLPTLTDDKPYCILNLDDSSQSGSHWVALAKYKNVSKYIVYDSFGRKTKDIIPSVLYKYCHNKVVDTHYDAEQLIEEMNCGQRCMAFLLLTDFFGVKNSIKL